MRGDNVEAVAWSVQPTGDFVVYVLKAPIRGSHPVLVRRDKIGPGGEWQTGEWLVAASPWVRTVPEWEAYQRSRQRGTAFVPSATSYLQVLQVIAERRAQVTEFCRAAAARQRSRYAGAAPKTYQQLTDDL